MLLPVLQRRPFFLSLAMYKTLPCLFHVGWTLHFVLGPSLTDKQVRVFVNHPQDAKTGPHRQTYRELMWQNYSSTKGDVYDNFAEVHMVLAGSFNYFFTIDGR